MIENTHNTFQPETVTDQAENGYLPTENDRLLQAEDFPPIELSAEQREALAQIDLSTIIIDHRNPDLAQVQAALLAEMKEHFQNMDLAYATNGGTKIKPPAKHSELPVTIIERENKGHYLGVTDLIAAAVQAKIAEKGVDNNHWITISSADVWPLHQAGLLNYLATAALEDKSLISSYWGGIGILGMIEAKNFYWQKNIIRNTYPGAGLCTEFFMIRSDLAAKTILNWNGELPEDEFAGDFGADSVYENFHHDPVIHKYAKNKRGTVETHFRYLVAKVLGNDFKDKVFFMHGEVPRKNGGLRHAVHRIFPNHIGYTSTHDSENRLQNLEIAEQYGFDIEAIPELLAWQKQMHNQSQSRDSSSKADLSPQVTSTLKDKLRKMFLT